MPAQTTSEYLKMVHLQARWEKSLQHISHEQGIAIIREPIIIYKFTANIK